MIKSVLTIAALAVGSAAWAAGGDAGFIQHAETDVSNRSSLQRGARNFVNYCAGCHSAKYVRYSRIAEDLGVSEDLVRDNLMFGRGKVGETIRAAMPAEHAVTWFGAAPPDLSLVSRVRGSDWIYSFLKSFYVDESKALGVNNLVLPGAAMPHVLADLQGLQAADFETVENERVNEEGQKEVIEQQQFAGFRHLTEGRLSEEQYDEFVLDITNFLDYIGEPMQLERQRLGYMVLAYLAILFVLAYALKKEFWKDVH